MRSGFPDLAIASSLNDPTMRSTIAVKFAGSLL